MENGNMAAHTLSGRDSQIRNGSLMRRLACRCRFSSTHSSPMYTVLCILLAYLDSRPHALLALPDPSSHVAARTPSLALAMTRLAPVVTALSSREPPPPSSPPGL